MNFKTFEAKIIKSGSNLNVKSLIQVVDEDDNNVGQGLITKALKTMYYVKYKTKTYKLKKSDVDMNEHGQAQTSIKNLN